MSFFPLCFISNFIMDTGDLLTAENLVFSDHEGVVHRAESFFLKLGGMGLVQATDHGGAVTFLQTLVFLHQRKSGTIRWFGVDSANLNPMDLGVLRRRIGLLHRDSALISNLSLHENLALGMEYHLTDRSVDVGQYIYDALELIDLQEKYGYRPCRLSALERYRALLIRELIKQPEVLLLEEPHLCIGFSWHDDIAILAGSLGIEATPSLLVVSSVETAEDPDIWQVKLSTIPPEHNLL
jgi:ABC-type ATPase involved in cell division